MKTNCKNCGAPMDINLDKCPYCGTRYLDLAIDVDKPFFLRFRRDGKVYECRGVLEDNISMEVDSDTIYGYRDGNFISLPGPKTVTLKPIIELLYYDNNRFMTIYDEEKIKND